MKPHRRDRRGRMPAARKSIRLEHLEDRRLLSATGDESSAALELSAGAAALHSTPGLYSPATGRFYLRNENAAGIADTAFQFGPSGQNWLPLAGDWNGDSTDTVGVYETTHSVFFLRNENSAGAADFAVAFGAAGNGMTPVTGDWNGDGIDTVGLYDSRTGWWFLRDVHARGIPEKAFSFGPAGRDWRPIVGDWDGDGVDTIGLYDPIWGTFYLRDENSHGIATTVYSYGPIAALGTPLSGDWNGDQMDTVGLYSWPWSNFHLRDVHQPGPADVSFDFGPFASNWVPLSGHWTVEFDQGIVNRAVVAKPGVQQNPSISVNPLDADHVVVAYMDYSLVDTSYAGIGVAVSHDGGITWQYSSVPVPEPFNEGAANPIVKFDDQGQVYVTYMAATFLGQKPHMTNMDIFNPEAGRSDRVLGFQSHNGIFVARSDEGGLTWNEPATVVSHLFDGQNEVDFEIIPDLGIDTFPVLPDGQPNPNHGNLYVTWSRVYVPGRFPGHPEIDGSIDIMVAVSRDGGQTWETRLQEKDDNGDPYLATVIEDSTNTVGLPGLSNVDQPHIAIGTAGEIYVSHGGGGDFTVHLSADAGAKFDQPDHATGHRIAFGTGLTTSTSINPLPNNHFRKNVVRAIAADPTRPGRVYAAELIDVFDPK